MQTWLWLALSGVAWAQDAEEMPTESAPAEEAAAEAPTDEAPAEEEAVAEEAPAEEAVAEAPTEEAPAEEAVAEAPAEEAPAEEPKPVTTLTAELGGSYTVGNAWVVNVTGGVKVGHTWGKNSFGADAGVNLNLVKTDADGNGTLSEAERQTDPVFTSQRVTGNLRYDRKLSDADSLFVSAGVQHDKLAGLNWRFTQGFGYQRALVATEPTQLNLELGLTYNEENFVTGTDDAGNTINDAVLDAHYMAARVFVGLRHAFNDKVQIGEDLEMIEPLVGSFADGATNFEDFRLNNTLFVQAKLSDIFSLKLSSTLAFDNQPVPDFVKTDHITALTLVASIF